jgi:hypothetical protein
VHISMHILYQAFDTSNLLQDTVQITQCHNSTTHKLEFNSITNIFYTN